MDKYQFQHEQSPELQKQAVDAKKNCLLEQSRFDISDYEFQYEQNPVLKRQATEAVKKTEWLEYLSHIKFMAGVKVFWAAVFAFNTTINLWETFSPPTALPPGQLTNYRADDIFPIFLMIVFVVTSLVFLLKWQGKFSLVAKRKYLIKKPKSRYILSACLAILPSLFFGLGTWRLRWNLSGFVLVISLAAWDLVDIKKLRQSFRARELAEKSIVVP